MTEREDPTLQPFPEDADPDFKEFYDKQFQWALDLDHIARFSEVPTIHKSTLLDHVSKVDSLSRHMASYLKQSQGINLDLEKLSRFALHHDDAEVITGDIPSPVKAAFTEEQRAEFKYKEDEAMQTLAEKYNTKRYQKQYLDDWKELSAKESHEAQLIEIADKWDGLCETLNDIRCGNDTPEILEVLNNYQKLFERITTLPLVDSIKQNSSFDFSHIPTVKEAQSLSKIDLNLLQEKNGKELFWERVFDPTLPNLYKQWLKWSVSQNSNDLGLFSRWTDTLGNFPLSFEDKILLLKRV